MGPGPSLSYVRRRSAYTTQNGLARPRTVLTYGEPRPTDLESVLAGTRPGILTGVLEATVRDPQVKDPSAGLIDGFAFQGGPASRAARYHSPAPHACSTARTPAALRQRPQPHDHRNLSRLSRDATMPRM
jgi:hypothetical protein